MSNIKTWQERMGKSGPPITSMQAEIADLRAALQTNADDAARYRFLREHLDDEEDHKLMEHKKGIDYGFKQGAKLDLAIDRAIVIAAAKQTEKQTP